MLDIGTFDKQQRLELRLYHLGILKSQEEFELGVLPLQRTARQRQTFSGGGGIPVQEATIG